MKQALSLALSAAFVCASPSPQERPTFSGTWQWVSRSVPHPLTIQQTGNELVIASLGLSQGNPVSEVFNIDGSRKTMLYDVQAFWQKQETIGRWDGDAFVGTVIAKAGWKRDGPVEAISLAIPHTVCTRTLRLSPDGRTLTITTSWYSPESGNKQGPIDDRFARVTIPPR